LVGRVRVLHALPRNVRAGRIGDVAIDVLVTGLEVGLVIAGRESRGVVPDERVRLHAREGGEAGIRRAGSAAEQGEPVEVTASHWDRGEARWITATPIMRRVAIDLERPACLDAVPAAARERPRAEHAPSLAPGQC